MPILKVISGHTGCKNVKRYLEKNNRAIAKDLFNLSWDEREMKGYEDSLRDGIDWAKEMDSTRELLGNDTAYEGRRARTYKHFVISPNPDDSITIDQLRELSSSWVLKHFPDHQIAIVYHEDNANHIPHAHIIVNNSNLKTGNRIHTDNPLELNRDLQKMAADRGLSALSNKMPVKEGLERLASTKEKTKPRTRQPVYMGRAERELVNKGKYSWVEDIRNRVTIAKDLARNENEFKEILKLLDVEISENSPNNRRRDWIFSMSENPAHKVSGEKLGLIYGKESLQQRFMSKAAYRPNSNSSREIVKAAHKALKLNDFYELNELATSIEVCAKYSINSLEDFDLCIEALSNRARRTSTPASKDDLIILKEAKEYIASKNLLPKRIDNSKPKSQITYERSMYSTRTRIQSDTDTQKQPQLEHHEQDRGAR